jgi:hypothetical protein
MFGKSLKSLYRKTPPSMFGKKRGWGVENEEFKRKMRSVDVDKAIELMLEFQRRWELAGVIAKGWIASAQSKTRQK